jgi:hypothetical protein
MAELVGWPELERRDDPLDPEATAVAPVEIRFEIKPGFGELLDPELTAECSIAGRPAASPGAVLTTGAWGNEENPRLYCYTLVRDLHDGDEVTLKVHPRDKKHRDLPDIVWAQDFRVHAEGDAFRLE